MNYDYYYGIESESFSFYRIPRLLVTDPQFRGLSSDAKLLYGLLLDRMGLSARNGWYDDEQRVFIYYTLDEIMEDMNCGHDKATKLLRDLDVGSGIGLIERVKQGLGKPTLIYVKNFMSFSAPTPAPAHTHTLGPMRLSRTPYRDNAAGQTVNPHSGLRESRTPDCGISAGNYNNQNHTKKKHTDFSYTDPSILPSDGEEDDGMDGCDEIDRVREQIEYDALARTYSASKLNCIVKIFRDVLFHNKPSFLIGGEEIPAAEVRKKFLSMNRAHVEYVFDALKQTRTMVKNWPQYLLTALYNSPNTIDFYYDAWVQHDFGGDTDSAG